MTIFVWMCFKTRIVLYNEGIHNRIFFKTAEYFEDKDQWGITE
jgi:hypothetical protein